MIRITKRPMKQVLKRPLAEADLDKIWDDMAEEC